MDSTTLATYFSKKTEELIKTQSFKGVGKGVNYVDIVKDVINLVPVHYISQELVRLDFLLYAFFSEFNIQAGLPLKTKANPQGVWSEQQTYEMFATIAQYAISIHLIAAMLNLL